MDPRMLKDYLRLFWRNLAFVTFSYAVISGMVADREYPVTFFLSLAFLSLASFSWTFFLDLQGRCSSGVIFTLPIPRQQLARTLWFEVVGVSTVSACLVFAAQWIALSISFHPWTLRVGLLFPPFFFACLMLTSGLWFFLATIRKSRDAWLFGALSVTAFACCVYYSLMLMGHWMGSITARITLAMGGFSMAAVSFQYSEKILELILAPQRGAPQLGRKRMDSTYEFFPAWIDRWQGHPIRIIIVKTWLIIIIPYALLLCGDLLLSTTTTSSGGIWPLVACVGAAIVSLVIFVLGATLDALRFWITLPMSRTTLAGTVVILPFAALLPLALILTFGCHYSLTIYTVLAALWLVVTGSALRWGRTGAISMLNVVLVILNFWPMLRSKMRESAAMIDNIGLTVTIIAAAVASVWIIHLLRSRSEPFRYHLTTFMKVTGSR